MSVIRIEKTNDYTVMSNRHFKEKEMSLKAKGLLSLMLSLPDDWDYTIAGLVSICKENETAIKSALNELKQFGYLQVIKNMPTSENGGRIDYEYIIYENPIQEHKKQELEILCVENPGQLNTNKSNTKNNKSISKDIDSQVTENLSKSSKIILSENVKCIIDYLNESIGSKYKYNTKGTISLIKARFNEGYVLDDFYDVIDKKVKEWANTDMQIYLRPSTLFGNKFENYLNQKVYFKGKPKTTYGTKPSFDNTINHKVEDRKFDPNNLARDEEGNLIKF